MYHAMACLILLKLSISVSIRKSAKRGHFRINYDLNLETAEFLELGLCDFGETLFSTRH